MISPKRVRTYVYVTVGVLACGDVCRYWYMKCCVGVFVAVFVQHVPVFERAWQ